MKAEQTRQEQKLIRCSYCGMEHLTTEKAKEYHKSKSCLKLTESDKLLREVLK